MSRISEILKLARFDLDAVEYFERVYEKISGDVEIYSLLLKAEERYFSGGDAKEERERIAELSGYHIYTVDMMLAVWCAVRLRRIYAEKGYSEEIFIGFLYDLRCKLGECREVYGIFGTFVFFWFHRFYDCTRFALGRLQFETISSKYDYKNVFRTGDTVYNCHIPSAGPLTPELVEDSLRRAYEFYGIKGRMPVVCHSWLLYPKHYEVFGEGSNIRAFCDRFDVIDSKEQDNAPDAWRVFGRGADDLERLPKDTSLQRAFYQYLKDGNKMGEGFGVLLYSPE